ncbi:MAG: TonB-dependent receptor [Gammaproteobacteria bacterium]|nr:TonB-dependent receptor [Gammaproteobacteria bacterium]
MRNRTMQPVITASPTISPLTHAIRKQLSSRHVVAAALISSTIALPQAGIAQHVLDEITVTATKRAESLQDVPISVTALSADTLEELGIVDFDGYAQMLPTLSYKSVGPGTATLIMRGASDGGDGNASGSQPSVGLYLDETPVTTIASNLDIHIYDIERIEALAGPQGTLFGASSQSGNLRIITNKPDSSEFSAGVDLGGSSTTEGDPSYSVEGYVNAPLSDTAAIRLVGWYLDEGGYIDNVAGTRTFILEGGYGYNPDPNAPYGRTATLDNDSFIAEDTNELKKVGARAALRIDLNDNWTADAGVIFQNLETDGTWDHDPSNVSDREIQRFFPDFSDDEFVQANITVEGKIGKNMLVYSGSIMDRDVQYQADYSAYGEDAYWVPYYVCDYSATGPDLATQTNTDCTSLAEYYQEDNQYERDTHELRLQSIGDGKFNYTVGVYYSKITHEYLQEWIQPGISPNRTVPGGADKRFFRTDQKREDEQTALFGEVTFDFSPSVSGTLGARFFQNDSKLEGVVGWGPVLFGDADTSVDASYDDSDSIFKLNLTWRVNNDVMLYFTASEGYRPGGLNRDPGLAAFGAAEYTPDFLTNYEIGWKTTLADGRVRLNGAAYIADWEDVQYTIYDFSLSRCCGSVYNLADADIQGLEVDVTGLITDRWTISASVAYNDGETKGDFLLINDRLAVPDGTELPNVPDLKGNIWTRYGFEAGGFDAYGQLALSYTGSSFNEIRPDQRSPQDSYSILNLRAGISKENWGIDAYINNATDEVAQLYVSPRPYEPSITTNRPRSIGVKYWKRF